MADEPIRLLLVDDEQAFINVLGKRLARRGVDATLASSGAEAIQHLRGRDFDVAVVDLKMEGMDGIELLGVFKKMLPAMPVIILTGHGSERAAREGVRQGAFDYLVKPCDLDRLLEKIRQAIA
ncbi:response regulator [Desulfocurvus sp. DL9XJH121]